MYSTASLASGSARTCLISPIAQGINLDLDDKNISPDVLDIDGEITNDVTISKLQRIGHF